MTQSQTPVRHAAPLLVLAVLGVAALASLLGGRASSDPAAASSGLQFSYDCFISPGSAGGEIGCSVIVDGLPSPLDSQVSVTIQSTSQGGDAPSYHIAGETLVASEATGITAGNPAVVVREVPQGPPTLVPLPALVPEPPPRYA